MNSEAHGLRSVGEVAELLGISVRTLHHWEERGLVVSSERSASNYRLYSEDDIVRMQQVMIYRATGMSLDAVRDVLDTDDDRLSRLQHQRALLMRKETELHRMVRALDELLEDAMTNNRLSVEDVAEILEDAAFPVYQAEAEQRWEGTDDWKVSAETTAAMSRADWEAVRERTRACEEALATAMHEGVAAGSPEANALAERHRTLLSDFFPVTHAKHVLIARGYVEDPRFSAHYDQRADGLAAWLKSVIDANAAGHGVDPDAAAWE
ncbi:MerR family transcriptional regulator [Leucobacter tardus]|uniref:MerR family transcriptional regulator n=1 Tax=Leucobacter tardus TaxID=501483 RepID=A0A939TUM3_9MICO|nr:MerR family transcriptional regulator [Leucobacter tardus]MBO2989880.1 MerR family transcriptional regulator [Leucobacter tardus]